MSPTHGRAVRQHMVRHGLTFGAKVRNRVGDVGRIPIGDRGDDEVQPRRAEMLRLVRPVGDAALLESADCADEEVALLGLIEARLAPTAEFRAFQQSSINSVRSTRPTSRNARSSWFWRS